jgi:serine protease Do
MIARRVIVLLASTLALAGLAAPAALAQQSEISGAAFAASMEQVISRAIATAEKSVVAIARVPKDRPGETVGLEFRPDPFSRRTSPFNPPKPTDADFMPKDFATGVVVDRQGLILTAYHALCEDCDYYVTTSDRRVYRAAVKGADPRSDLAVLAIEATDLAPIQLGDAARLKKGQIVIALGNPYAIARDGQVSASWGIVSNLTRKAPLTPDESDSAGKSTLHHFGTLIQTDAKLNLGTSGGALVNLKGEMVGLTTSLAASAGYEQAAGYAFPVDATFRRVLETLKQGREVEYGLLGVRPTNLTAHELLQGLRGCRVQGIVRGTPAQRFGLQEGDLVTTVNGIPVYEADGLVLEVGRLPVESTVRLGVVRNGKKLDVDVTLTKFPVRGTKVVTNRDPNWRGIRVDYASAAIDAEAQATLGLPEFDEGVVVTEVEQGSPAWNAGLRPKNLITQVDHTPVRNPREFLTAVAGKTGSVQVRLTEGVEENAIRTIGPGT